MASHLAAAPLLLCRSTSWYLCAFLCLIFEASRERGLCLQSSAAKRRDEKVFDAYSCTQTNWFTSDSPSALCLSLAVCSSLQQTADVASATVCMQWITCMDADPLLTSELGGKEQRKERTTFTSRCSFSPLPHTHIYPYARAGRQCFKCANRRHKSSEGQMGNSLLKFTVTWKFCRVSQCKNP